MTHSPKGAKPRFDEVEHKLYNRISSRLSSARQNRERSKSLEEIRRVRSPLRVSRRDRDNVGPRSQQFREETRTRNGTESPRDRRDRYRSRSRSPIVRVRGARTRSLEKRTSRNSRRERRSFSGPRRRYRTRSASESPRRKKNSYRKSPRDENRSDAWAWSNGDEEKITKVEKAKKKDDPSKPNFSLSGKLTEDTNTYKGVVIKYNEPAEARMPKKRWRLYPFKGDESLPTLYIHRQSAYLIGRDRVVTDFPVHHPSCSKQHAVFQYRLVEVENSEGAKSRQIKLYIIDLNSTNGTYVNNKRIEPQRYIELKATDMLRFGFSSREYILLNEDSQEEEIQLGSDQERNSDDSSHESDA